MSQQHCKTFSQENTAFFLFTKHDSFFRPCIWQACLRCAAVWQRLPAAQTRARLQNRSYLEQPQNSSERRCSPPLAAAPTQRITGANVRLPWWRSERPASVWPWGSSGWRGPSVSGPARPAAPGPARAGAAPSGSASCRTPRSGYTQAPRLCEDTKRVFFFFSPPLLNIWKRTRAPVNCISVCSPSGASIHPKTGYSEQIMEDDSFQWISLSLRHRHAHTHAHACYKGMNGRIYHEYFVALGMHGLTGTNSQKESVNRQMRVGATGKCDS